MHPITVIKVSKEDRGWDFNPDTGADIWFYHNESGKYNERPIRGQILETIRCHELVNRVIIIVLCENSIERYPVMLDSTYDIIGNSKKDVKNRARLCSTKHQRTNVMSTFRATIKLKETITQGWDSYIDIKYLYVYSNVSVEDVRNKAKELMNDMHMGDFSIPLNIVETELQFIEEIEPEIVLRKYLT